ncbi:hypothetical protein [Vibrio phage LP.2]|nr:hypothetical protein [Vibrio phage LP.2]
MSRMESNPTLREMANLSEHAHQLDFERFPPALIKKHFANSLEQRRYDLLVAVRRFALALSYELKIDVIVRNITLIINKHLERKV